MAIAMMSGYKPVIQAAHIQGKTTKELLNYSIPSASVTAEKKVNANTAATTIVKPVVKPVIKPATQPSKPLSAPLTSAPQPTVATQNLKTVLSAVEIVTLTNAERTKSGLLELADNAKLNAVAEARLKDMFDQHYFAHVAPDGSDMVSVAKTFGYPYNRIGENLALGTYRSSTSMMNSWMNSSGHRANILSKNYTEIGVAVAEGIFDGRKQWLGVQIFGRQR